MSDIMKIIASIISFLFLLALLWFGGVFMYNNMRVWTAETAGRAALAQATQDRQIKTLEAKGKAESARYEAEAEVERAKGVASANDIIMNRLGGPANYLTYLQIQALESSNANLIYVPTEGGLPVTEAGRLRRAQQ